MEQKHQHLRRLNRLYYSLDDSYLYFLRNPHGIYAVHDIAYLILDVTPFFYTPNGQNTTTQLEQLTANIQKDLDDAILNHNEGMNPTRRIMVWTATEIQAQTEYENKHLRESHRLIRRAIAQLNQLGKIILSDDNIKHSTFTPA